MKNKDYMDNLNRMTNDELAEQHSINKKRIIGNNAFLGAITIGSLIAFPPIALATLGVSAFRTYHISKNNESIEKEAEDRGMVLKKTRKMR